MPKPEINNSGLNFPHISILKASAGSGKTHALTRRYVQFALSEDIKFNGLRNILAVTFSNNAAKEMKERVLEWLKLICFGDDERTGELCQLLSSDKEQLQHRAHQMIEEILDNYTDFQVRTIDSFMTTVFKSSAIDFGYNPDFEILLDSSILMKYSFDLFLRKVKKGTDEAGLLDTIVNYIGEHRDGESAYLWDPSTALLKEITGIYKKLSSSLKEPFIPDLSFEMGHLKNEIRSSVEAIEAQIISTGLDRHGNSSYKRSDFPLLVREGRFAELVGKGMSYPPVNKLKSGQEQYLREYETIIGNWEGLKLLISRYTECYARSYYYPYLRIYSEFSRTLETVKRHQEKVFIEDINSMLAEYIRSEIIPDIYFRIGEMVYHYLIDEFQDTSPVQWNNLYPLVENSLSQNGSLFVVGDTKQAVYGFRNADYTIMRDLEESNPFRSAEHNVEELKINYRSLGRILEFNQKVFKCIAAESPQYSQAAGKTGLIDYEQSVRKESVDPGHAEVLILERNSENPPEKHELQSLIFMLKERGFDYGDIAVLTRKNEEAVQASGWLNEKNIPFISYSNLDIRRRKITGEIVSLLSFLDSPIDDHAFASFILGDIFLKTLSLEGSSLTEQNLRSLIFAAASGQEPIYKSFMSNFPELWNIYFSRLFKVSGYFPVYDLVASIFGTFRLFELCIEEEAALSKMLDLIKDFEGAGYNSLRDFLDFADDEEVGASDWNMDVPRSLNAVKVMTIHKAKGLGFPVVIVLLYGDQNRGFDYIEDVEGDRFSLIKITKEISKNNRKFEELYNEAVEKELVNRLNSLYVGFTRPEEELYVIGIKRENENKYPFDLLPETDFPHQSELIRKHRAEGTQRKVFEITHRHKEVSFRNVSYQTLSTDEKRRGEFIHKVLAMIEYAGSDMDEKIRQLIRKLNEASGLGYSEADMTEPIIAILKLKEIGCYFIKQPDRQVRREAEYADSQGRLFRMDRVIIDKDRITVIDFKTGRDIRNEDQHKEQIRTYISILSDIYKNRYIEGVIVYIDLLRVSVVR